MKIRRMYERNCEQENGSRNREEEKRNKGNLEIKMRKYFKYGKITEKKGSGSNIRNKGRNAMKNWGIHGSVTLFIICEIVRYRRKTTQMFSRCSLHYLGFRTALLFRQVILHPYK